MAPGVGFEPTRPRKVTGFPRFQGVNSRLEPYVVVLCLLPTGFPAFAFTLLALGDPGV